MQTFSSELGARTAKRSPCGTLYFWRSSVNNDQHVRQCFEGLLQGMGILLGALTYNENGYLNEHVQWLWQQYLRNQK